MIYFLDLVESLFYLAIDGFTENLVFDRACLHPFI